MKFGTIPTRSSHRLMLHVTTVRVGPDGKFGFPALLNAKKEEAEEKIKYININKRKGKNDDGGGGRLHYSPVQCVGLLIVVVSSVTLSSLRVQRPSHTQNPDAAGRTDRQVDGPWWADDERTVQLLWHSHKRKWKEINFIFSFEKEKRKNKISESIK